MDKLNTSEKKRLIVVLGMHRCGTSAITRGLEVMGVPLGDRLMLPDAGNNDKGFWEDIDINELNVEMLRALGNDWHQLSLLKKEDFAQLKRDGFFQRAAALLQQKTLHTPIFGFKDPRISKLLAFWKEVFDAGYYDVSYILAVRHPISVALSLANRNGIDMEKSHLLWLIHVIKSLSGIEGNDFVVVDYDKLLQDASRELKRIADKFRLKIDMTALEMFQSEFLDPNLRHTEFRYEDLMSHERSSDFLRDVFANVMSLTLDNQKDFDELPQKTARWEAALEQLNLSFMMADKAFTYIDIVHQQLVDKDVEIQQAKLENEAEVAKTNESIQKANELAAHIDVLQQQLAEKDRIILEEKEENLSLRSSKSWRITKPLRYVDRLLKNKNSKGQ